MNSFYEGERIYFRPVTPEDADGNYFGWMNDTEVTQYLESRFFPVTHDELKKYIQKTNTTPNTLFLAISTKSDDRHIGNIKLSPINWIHRLAEMGGMIGEKDCWGKGYATEAFKLIANLAFERMNLHKITSGSYANNPGSIKALLNAGYVQEGIRTKHNFCNGKYVDAVLFGKLRPDLL